MELEPPANHNPDKETSICLRSLTMQNYSVYPLATVEDIARLRRRIAASGLPAKSTDQNLIIGTWNIRAFGAVYPSWMPSPSSPKRNLRALASIAEVIRCMDVVAIQEVKRDLSGLYLLLDWLGPDWGHIVSDVTAGEGGNTERLAYVYDLRRVTPTGLAGEIVLPPNKDGFPLTQFARSPFMVGFRAGEERFTLLTAHIKYGNIPLDRIGELQDLASYIAKEIRDPATQAPGGEPNLIVLGDFNIDKRSDNPLFQAFISSGLQVPPQLEGLRTAFGTVPKYYDQIAWFMGQMNMNLIDAGTIDFAGACFPEITLQATSFRVSDHLPLWAAFDIDHSAEKMARTLGIDPGMPDPLSVVPD